MKIIVRHRKKAAAAAAENENDGKKIRKTIPPEKESENARSPA